jgi:hypothetical protein
MWGRDSVVGIETRYRLDGPEVESNPCVDEIFHIRPDLTWGLPSLLYNGHRAFPWVKRSGRGVVHPTPPSVEVKERVELYIFSPSGLSWPVLGQTLPFLPLTDVSILKHTSVISRNSVRCLITKILKPGLCFPMHQLLLTIYSFSDTNYITFHNYRVSLMGVAFSGSVNELAQPRLIFLSTSHAR